MERNYEFTEKVTKGENPKAPIITQEQRTLFFDAISTIDDDVIYSAILDGSLFGNLDRHSAGAKLAPIRELFDKNGITRDIVEELVHEARVVRIDEFFKGVIETFGIDKATNILNDIFSGECDTLGGMSYTFSEAGYSNFTTEDGWLEFIDPQEVSETLVWLAVRDGVEMVTVTEDTYMQKEKVVVRPGPSDEARAIDAVFTQFGHPLDFPEEEAYESYHFSEDSYLDAVNDAIFENEDKVIAYYIDRVAKALGKGTKA